MDEVAKELDVDASNISATMGLTDERALGKGSETAGKKKQLPVDTKQMRQMNRGVESPYTEVKRFSKQKEQEKAKEKASGSFIW